MIFINFKIISSLVSQNVRHFITALLEYQGLVAQSGREKKPFSDTIDESGAQHLGRHCDRNLKSWYTQIERIKY